MNINTKRSAQIPAGRPDLRLSQLPLLLWSALEMSGRSVISAVLFMGVENALGVTIEQSLAGSQPLCRLVRQGRAVKIELLDLLQPALELLQVGVFFFKLRIGELVDRDFLGDLLLEIVTATKELRLLVVTIGFEPGYDLILLRTIESDRLQDDGITIYFGNIVFQHLQPRDVIVGLGLQADAVLQINGAHSLQPPPERNALCGGIGRHFVSEKKPSQNLSCNSDNATTVTPQLSDIVHLESATEQWSCVIILT